MSNEKSLTGSDLHISSVIVWALPGTVERIAQELSGRPAIHLRHMTEDNKMIMTLETSTFQETLDCIDTIQQIPGVLAANLVYHHVEPASELELTQEVDA